MDQRSGRVVQPVTIGLGIACRPRLPSIDLLCKGLEADVPVGDVTEHAGHRPVLVHGRGQRLVVQRLDECAQALSLTRVRFDERPIFTQPTIHPGRRDASKVGQGRTQHQMGQPDRSARRNLRIAEELRAVVVRPPTGEPPTAT